MDLEEKKLKEVAELEPLVIEKIEKLEEGLIVLDHQLNIGENGRPDIFAIDSDNSFVLIELKSVKANPYAISQSIRYYEWLIQNLALVARTFPKINTSANIRIFIIAPSFEEESINIARYLNLDLNLVEYIALQETKTKEIDLIFQPLDTKPLKGSNATFFSVKDIINYISDDTISKEFIKCLEHLKENNIKVEPWKGGKDNWLVCYYDNDDIAFFRTRKNFFHCQTYDEDKCDYIWPPHKLFSYDEWLSKCWNDIYIWIKEFNEDDDS